MREIGLGEAAAEGLGKDAMLLFGGAQALRDRRQVGAFRLGGEPGLGAVEHVTVDAHDGLHVFGRLHAPLDF